MWKRQGKHDALVWECQDGTRFLRYGNALVARDIAGYEAVGCIADAFRSAKLGRIARRFANGKPLVQVLLRDIVVTANERGVKL